ncbi:MAG: hypothetical protein ACOY3Y_04890 [Acidobacteriota bacterium]
MAAVSLPLCASADAMKEASAIVRDLFIFGLSGAHCVRMISVDATPGELPIMFTAEVREFEDGEAKGEPVFAVHFFSAKSGAIKGFRLNDLRGYPSVLAPARSASEERARARRWLEEHFGLTGSAHNVRLKDDLIDRECWPRTVGREDEFCAWFNVGSGRLLAAGQPPL